MIFPEGLISPLAGGFHKARTGVARLAIASGAPVFPVGIHLQKDRLHTLRSVVSGKEEISHWYLRGPYSVTVGAPMRFTGDINDHEHVKDSAHQIMVQIMKLAYESEQRWMNKNQSMPNALEAI